MVKRSSTAITSVLFMTTPRRPLCASMMEVPFRAVKSLFQPPERVRFFSITTTASQWVLVYVPEATAIASPAGDLVIAPLIVAQGDPGWSQEFESLPVGETYHQLLFSRLNTTDPAPL